MIRLIVLLLLAGLLACGRSHDVLPEEVCGRWITDDPKYVDCYMDISNEHVSFGNQDANLDMYWIVDVKREGQGAEVRYTLTYLDSTEEESTFVFDHLITRAAIRVTHSPKRIWTRQRDPLPEDLEESEEVEEVEEVKEAPKAAAQPDPKSASAPPAKTAPEKKSGK